LEQIFLDAIKFIMYLLKHDSPKTKVTQIKENKIRNNKIVGIKTGLF